MATEATLLEAERDVVALAEALNHCCDTLEVPDGLFTDDAFFDLYPPLWRFQLQGPKAFEAQLRVIAGDADVRASVVRVVLTATGFILEHDEEARHGDDVEVARRIWLCEVQDGRIAEVTCFCNGGWDAELRARHAAETTLLRP
jgi:ketosteroid isomerase-like protein